MIKLYYKTDTYKDKDGKERSKKEFYIKVNDKYVPIQMRYYNGDKFRLTNLANYNTLSAVAESLPTKE